MTSGGDHLLFSDNGFYDEDAQYEDSYTCDYCDGSGKYWETNANGKWIKVVCICTEPQT